MTRIEQKYTKEQLRNMQALPLERKVGITLARIMEWVQYWGEDKCAVSWSGGKDSTVLLYLVRGLFPNIKVVFADTGLEHPKIREFVKKDQSCIRVTPPLNFMEVIREHGYPIISKEVAETIERSRKAIDEINNAGEGGNLQAIKQPYTKSVKTA